MPWCYIETVKYGAKVLSSRHLRHSAHSSQSEILLRNWIPRIAVNFEDQKKKKKERHGNFWLLLLLVFPFLCFLLLLLPTRRPMFLSVQVLRYYIPTYIFTRMTPLVVVVVSCCSNHPTSSSSCPTVWCWDCRRLLAGSARLLKRPWISSCYNTQLERGTKSYLNKEGEELMSNHFSKFRGK